MKRMSFVVLYCLFDFLLLQLGREVFFFSTRFTGHCSRRIFDFSDGSIFWSPLVVSIGELIWGVVDKFLIICFANLQNAVVLVSIDEIFLKFSRIGFLLLLLFVF